MLVNMDMAIAKIEDLGWDDFFASKRAELGLGEFSVARVTAEHRGAYRVKNEKGEFLAKMKGKQMFGSKSREDYPAVGDWLAISELDNAQAQVEFVLPRKSIIKRSFGDKDRTGEKKDLQIIATNIDVAFIVQSVGRDYNINRFERYLAIVKDTEIEPVIILNKIDLISSEELDAKLAELKTRLGEREVILTSVANGAGLDELKAQIQKGKTYCFLGSSGVGKSSLINKLLGKDDVKTGAVSAHSDRGRHVTTSREMYFLESGGIMVDNPGIREVGLTDVGAGIDGLFDEIVRLAEKCKYADCTHSHEPGCNVLRTLKEGGLDRESYANYLSLKKETSYFDLSRSKKREQKRSFGKFINKAKKELKNFGHKNF